MRIVFWSVEIFERKSMKNLKQSSPNKNQQICLELDGVRVSCPQLINSKPTICGSEKFIFMGHRMLTRKVAVIGSQEITADEFVSVLEIKCSQCGQYLASVFVQENDLFWGEIG